MSPCQGCQQDLSAGCQHTLQVSVLSEIALAKLPHSVSHPFPGQPDPGTVQRVQRFSPFALIWSSEIPTKSAKPPEELLGGWTCQSAQSCFLSLLSVEVAPKSTPQRCSACWLHLRISFPAEPWLPLIGPGLLCISQQVGWGHVTELWPMRGGQREVAWGPSSALGGDLCKVAWTVHEDTCMSGKETFVALKLWDSAFVFVDVCIFLTYFTLSCLTC